MLTNHRCTMNDKQCKSAYCRQSQFLLLLCVIISVAVNTLNKPGYRLIMHTLESL